MSAREAAGGTGEFIPERTGAQEGEQQRGDLWVVGVEREGERDGVRKKQGERESETKRERVEKQRERGGEREG